MSIKKYKIYKKEKSDKKIELLKIQKKIVVGKEFIPDILEHYPEYIKMMDSKNNKLVGFLKKDREKCAYAIKYMKNGKEVSLVPIFLMIEKENSCFDYKYNLLMQDNVVKKLIPFLKETRYSLVMDRKWQLMIRFTNKEDALKFLEPNLDYTELRERALKEFEINDAINSGQTKCLENKLFLQLVE